MNATKLAYIITLALLAGCAGSGAGVARAPVTEPVYREIENPYFAEIAQISDTRGKDRAAILAMRGDYRVGFAFQETVPLKAGYQLHDDKTTGGFETVVVVQDDAKRIVLQHILVASGGQVIKHWRQDWVFEANHRFEFVADQTWAVRAVAADIVKGSWTQCVFEVSDAPRYCGTGKWNHRYGVSTWTSDRGFRPLPRREYTKRDDYNALNVENRHTITSNGWSHEQDNTKTVRDGSHTVETLVREFGFNDYRSIAGYDFTPAQRYWRNTASYWELVRAEWAQRLQLGTQLSLDTEVDGMPIIEATFAQAEVVSETSAQDQRHSIVALLNKWTQVQPAL